MDAIISQRYAHRLKTRQLIRCHDTPWTCVRDGDCSLAVQSEIPLQLDVVDAKVNSDCRMKRVGIRPVVSMGGGWMVRVDHHSKCASLLADVLNSHLLALKSGGELDIMLNNLVEGVAE